MALVLDSNPLSISANSYVSLADMLSYVSTRVPDPDVVTAWPALSTDKQTMYLVNASRSIDRFTDWIGNKYSRDQGMSWPRTEAYVDGFHVDNTIFPLPVVEATCEMALWMMINNGEVAIGQNAQFRSIKIDVIDIDFNTAVAGAKDKYFPDIVPIILRDYGTMTDPALPGGNTMKTVKLVRA